MSASEPTDQGDLADEAEAPPESDEVDELLPPGNRPRVVRGGALLGLGTLGALAVMGRHGQSRAGLFAGILAVLVAAFGALDLAGTFDDEDGVVVRRTSARALGGPVGALVLAVVVMLGALTMATAGELPYAASAVLVTASALAVVLAGYRVGERIGVWSDERPLVRRHGFWVVATACALYLPAMGAHSLTDPWETHYGEVAREMLARDDWVSTWWAQDGWFFSKPVLGFWLQAISMEALGVKFGPGQMLAPGLHGEIPQPEWAVRAPVVALAVAALYLLYKGVARVFGRRAGMLGALVLMSMPQWAMLAHQTMADMPFVAAMTAAMGLLLIELNTDPDERVRLYEVSVGRWTLRLSAFHLVMGAVLVAALPQIFYLVSRNVELLWRPNEHGFHWHHDLFMAGSRGNCGLPGNEPCVMQVPYNTLLQPAVQAALWALALGSLVHLNAGERRAQRLAYLAAFGWAAVSTLGKGPAGLALPALCALLYVAVTGKWRELTRMEVLSGTLLILAVAMPWYLAMYLRHGPAFIDRLIFHDMWKRALTHVHDTNEGEDVGFRFYVWQLGYALFPWTGLVPAGLVWWTRRPDDADRGQGDASVFLVSWFVLAFALFTAMLTKFHHYIFPAVPPAAMLTGVLLDRALGRGPLPPWRVLALGGSGALLAATLAQLGPGRLDGIIDGTLSPPSIGAAMTLGTAAALLAWWGARGVMAAGTEQSTRGAIENASGTPRNASGTTKDASGTPKPASGTREDPSGTHGALSPCPGRDDDGPGHGSDRPGHGSDRPGCGSDRPGHGSDRPGRGSDRPGHGSDRPGRGSDRPGHGSDRPGRGSDRPGHGSDRPGRDDDGSGHGSDRPGHGSDRPGRSADQAGEDGDRLSPGAGRSGGESADDALLLGALLVGGAAVLILVGRDLAARPANEVVGDARLLHLFTYNYRRLWPETLSFGAALVATAGAAAVLTLALGGQKLRRAAAVALTGLGLTFAAWSLDVYFVKTAPHWGQREVLEAYYVMRKGPSEPIVAYQMNWKGENFYTGNHINAFVSSGDRFKTWLKEQRAVGMQTMFVVVEQNRVGNLKRELDPSTQLETLVDRATNNKFTLVRVRWPDRMPGGTMTPQVP